MIDKHIPGARLKRGPTVAGKANFLLAVDDQHKRDVFLKASAPGCRICRLRRIDLHH